MCVLWHSLVLRCLCGRESDQIIVGFRVSTCCRWTCSVCGPWFVWVVVFVCGRWVHAISSGWHHCARSSGQVCSMSAVARNRCRQCWKTHSLTSGRRLDSSCVIRHACGITTGVLKVRTVVCLMFASFRNNCLPKVGWTRATHALHRCSFSVQLFRGIVFPRVCQ